MTSRRCPEEPDVWYTEEERTADRVFYDKDKLESYIKSQYRFYEYGIWAVVRKADDVIVGKAGVTNLEESEHSEFGNKTIPTEESAEYLELGYHIFRPYRRQGYAEEACRAILNYAKEELACPVCARVGKRKYGIHPVAGEIKTAVFHDRLQKKNIYEITKDLT